MKSVRCSDQRGMTLIELAIVVVVIGILSAIATPVYLSQRDKARDAAVKGSMRAIQVGIVSYTVDHDGAYPASDFVAYTPNDTTAANLGNGYIDDWPDNPWTGQPMKNTVAGVPVSDLPGASGLSSAQGVWTVVVGQAVPAAGDSSPAGSGRAAAGNASAGDFAYSTAGSNAAYGLVGWTSSAGDFVAQAL